MKLQELLAIDLPLIQAPMAGVQDHALAVAVSNAGALGSLPCALLGPKQLHAVLEKIRSEIRGPYNLNFFCHQPPTPNVERDGAWRATLASYYAEFGLDEQAMTAGPRREPFNLDMVKLLEQFRPPVVSFHFGLPAPELLSRVRATGAKILSSATTIEEACWLESRGVDAIIAQGLEAGGHRGMFLSQDLSTQVGTFALVPQLIRAVRVPVIAAGGIADARGVAAALALGAAGVQVGTAYLVCTEATTSSLHRQALLGKAAHQTVVTNLFTGRPARGLVNRLIRELGPIGRNVPEFPLAADALAPLRAAAESRGLADFSPMWAGQNTAGCQSLPAAQITRLLSEGFRRN